MDKDLYKILTEFFEVDKENARATAERQTMDSFNSRLSRLESTLGEDNAYDIVKGGRILNYDNGFFEEYLGLVHKLTKDMRVPNGRVDEEMVREHIGDLMDLDSLKSSLEGERGYDIRRVNPFQYRVLHPDNNQSRSYFNSLVDDNTLTIGENEHWCKSPREQGPRGINILKKLAYEIKLMFHEAGLPEPNLDLEFAQHRISIDKETAERLRAIRDKTYNL